MAPKRIKLKYFNARGRAEVSRLLLAIAGQKYEDVRIPGETWATEKSKTPFGQMPVLELDGEQYGQSVAIATYLAREFGFYGKTNMDGLKIGQVVQLCVDYTALAFKAFYEKDESMKAELLKTIKVTESPKYMGFFETLLRKSGTGYFVGTSITLADIYVYDIIFAFSQRGILSRDGYPLIQAIYKKVDSHEKIKAYVSRRKPTDM